MTARSALIFGISGQDGALLANLLRARGYSVAGTSRDAAMANFGNLDRVGVREEVSLHSAVTTDFRSVVQVLKRVAPDEIYWLAGQTSVGLSFEQPAETMESIAVGTLNLLEAIRFLELPARIYNAGSSECFGELTVPANEDTAFRPRSPYAVAKASAHWLLANYREAYGLYACTGFLFNHESPLRPERFVTQKIIAAACRIADGSKERLRLGNVEIHRDWGWAPEYVDAMWRMLQQPVAEDFVIATGRAHSLAEFVTMAFEEVGLDSRDHVDCDESLRRPTDIAYSVGNAGKAEARLGWRARFNLAEIIREMVAARRGGVWSMRAA